MVNGDIQRDQVSRYLKIRCPKCFKLYSVNPSELHEAKPRFECLDCQQKFWIPFPEAIDQPKGLIGFPVEWIEEKAPVEKAATEPEAIVHEAPLPEQKPFECPKCSAPYEGGAKDCKSCGIIFDKIKESRKSDEPNASRELKERWDFVVSVYEDFEQHEAFIAAAQLETSLAYALHKYKQVLEVSPADEMALKARSMIEALMTAKVESQLKYSESPASTGLGLPKLRLGTFILFLCAVTIGMGLLIPGARNLVGVGSAIMFFVLALRYYFRVL